MFAARAVGLLSSLTGRPAMSRERGAASAL